MHALHVLSRAKSPKHLADSAPITMQGVIKTYDPETKQGLVITDTDLSEYELADNALDGSIFRILRQGQRVIFDLDSSGRATALRLGSEADMSTPGH